MGHFGELPAERLRRGEVYVPHGVVVPLGQLRGQLARQLSDDPLPLALRHFVLPDPEAPGERDLHLILAWATLRLAGRAAHCESARRAPAEFDPSNLTLISALDSSSTL